MRCYISRVETSTHFELPEPSAWLSIPEAADLLGVRQRDVRSMLTEHALVAVRRGENNALAICGGEFVEKGGEIVALPALRGTLIQLADAGFSDDEALAWLLAPNEFLGLAPLDSLRQGNVKAVRRAIQFLAF